jgi:hypothetical protein
MDEVEDFGLDLLLRTRLADAVLPKNFCHLPAMFQPRMALGTEDP